MTLQGTVLSKTIHLGRPAGQVSLFHTEINMPDGTRLHLMTVADPRLQGGDKVNICIEKELQ